MVYLDDDAVLTSHMYFPEDVTDDIYAGAVYNTHEGRRRRNDEDGIFRRAGHTPVLDITPLAEGYVGTLTLGVARG